MKHINKYNTNGNQEAIYGGLSTNAPETDGDEWWETEEGIEAMKERELLKYQYEREMAGQRKMHLGRRFTPGE